MSNQDVALMAHLMRRAGFGATRDELEEYMAKGYEATVEELLHPADPQNMPDDIIRRYHVDHSELRHLSQLRVSLLDIPHDYHQVPAGGEDSPFLARPIRHGLLKKLNHPRAMLNQIDMFRRHGLGDFSTLLVELSKDPAMIIWLDNQDNHKGAINENFGRELLELFSMGIGNYTEQDIKECARAFTGLDTSRMPSGCAYCAEPRTRCGPTAASTWHFNYRDYDHDDGEKTFLGETGKFNGDDVIGIIVRQEATALFICRRLFQYFVADEVDEDGEQLIQTMMQTYFESEHGIRSVLRTLFKSALFPSRSMARFARVKGPAELLVGAVRMAGSYREPTIGAYARWPQQVILHGTGTARSSDRGGLARGLSNGLTVGALVERVNFAAKRARRIQNPAGCTGDHRAGLQPQNGGSLSARTAGG